MTNERFELTRRKVLAGLGSVGIASAGAGLGTTAYFSDEESFKNNELVAGQLDMTVAWQEHYSDWSPDENDDRTDDFGGDEFDTDLDGDGVDDFDVVMTEGDPDAVPDGYVGFPSFDAPMVAVPEAAMDDFLDNTAVEAFPDEDDDGIQEVILTRDQIATQYPTLSSEEIEAAFHDQFADVPDALEAPVIEIEDAKPGDFGEVTFSTHLHNNPGYLWLTGELLDSSENGLTEPERKDADEEAGVVELLDEVQVVVWYDDGDNVREPEEQIRSPHDVEDSTNITLGPEDSLIASGTLREILGALNSGVGIPLDADPVTAERECYPNSTTYNFGFAWWLPVDHANEIQSDSVTFDLGFYTEQCRHNDGSGLEELASVTFEDDDLAEDSVTVSSVFLPNGGYVAIHDARLAQSPPQPFDSVIGVSDYLPSGTHEDVQIPLFTGVPGQTSATFGASPYPDQNGTLIAMPHRETTVNTTYDFVATGNEDGPYLDENGDPVVDPATLKS